MTWMLGSVGRYKTAVHVAKFHAYFYATTAKSKGCEENMCTDLALETGDWQDGGGSECFVGL